VQVKKYRPTKYEAALPERCYPNVVDRQFVAERPNSIWVTDITYVWTSEGWLYVAVVLDLFARKIVGQAMSKYLDAELACSAFRQAVLHRRPGKGLVCHSDRGSQYTSDMYRDFLANQGFVGSMSRKGNCWDNAVAESFFRTLKVELVYQTRYRTREDAKRSIFEYIEIYYNRKRVHSANGYRSPHEHEKQAFLTLNNVH